MYMVILKVSLEFMGEMGEMTCIYMVILKFFFKIYGRNDIEMTCTWLSLNFSLKFMGEMTCTWLSLKFSLKFMGEMT